MSQGTLFVVSAPSGAGKTSLVRKLRSQVGGLSVSVSHTTRPKRPAETEGVDYFFTLRETFEEMAAAGAFLEYAQVFGNYYGTAHASVENYLSCLRHAKHCHNVYTDGAKMTRKPLPDGCAMPYRKCPTMPNTIT